DDLDGDGEAARSDGAPDLAEPAAADQFLQFVAAAERQHVVRFHGRSGVGAWPSRCIVPLTDPGTNGNLAGRANRQRTCGKGGKRNGPADEQRRGALALTLPPTPATFRTRAGRGRFARPWERALAWTSFPPTCWTSPSGCRPSCSAASSSWGCSCGWP